jgi:hypothetical protein
VNNNIRDVSYKRNLLFRKNHGRIIFDDYLLKIQDLFNVSSDQIVPFDLEKTDDILSGHIKAEQDINIFQHIIKYTITEKGSIAQEMARLSENIKGPYYVLVDRDWEYCGAFTIASIDSIRKEFIFGNEVSDDVSFISFDLLMSISFDFYQINGEYYIDVEKKRFLSYLPQV